MHGMAAFRGGVSAGPDMYARQSAADGTVPCCSSVLVVYAVAVKLVALAGVGTLRATSSTSGIEQQQCTAWLLSERGVYA